MNEMIITYQKSLQRIFDHVGFEGEPNLELVLNIDDKWTFIKNSVCWAKEMTDFNTMNEFSYTPVYTDDIVSMNDSIYVGKYFTLVKCKYNAPSKLHLFKNDNKFYNTELNHDNVSGLIYYLLNLS